MPSLALAPSWAPVLSLWVTLWAAPSHAYFADWSAVGARGHEPTCVDIPKNMSLCSGIGYDKMRLPNLLEHDTLTEVQHQAGSWVPLLQVGCHPHTQLFLCSLFTPVCLESQIFPCRSLCQAVQKGCESRMRTYGYFWPDMLRCDKFPVDNDMCIKSNDAEAASLSDLSDKASNCSACNPVDTYENILDNFCRSEVVLRGALKQKNGKTKLSIRKPRLFKGAKRTGKASRKKSEKWVVDQQGMCCNFVPEKSRYLIMGMKGKKKTIIPTFILTWERSKALRQAVRVFRNLDCDDPNLFTSTADDGNIVPKAETAVPKTAKDRKLKRNKNKNRRKNARRINRRKNLKRKNQRKGHGNFNDKESQK